MNVPILGECTNGLTLQLTERPPVLELREGVLHKHKCSHTGTSTCLHRTLHLSTRLHEVETPLHTSTEDHLHPLVKLCLRTWENQLSRMGLA